MKNPEQSGEGTLGRSLLVGAVIFGLLAPYRLYVVPLYPGLAAPPFDLLAVALAAAAAWWVAFRGWRR